MKKLKLYINAHPRLRKCLKIGEFLLALWGVILTIILSIGLAMSNSKINTPLVYANRDKVQQEAISFTNYDFYSSNELISEENLINYIEWVYDADGIDLYGITSTYTKSLTFNGSAYFIQSQNVTPSNISNNSIRYMTIQNILFTARPRTTYDTNHNSQRFDIQFVSTTNSDQYIMCVYFRIYNASLGTTTTWLTNGLYYYVDDEVRPYRSDLSLVVENPQSTDIAWSRQFLNFYGSSSSVSSDSYDRGYERGYENGKSRGWHNGYEQGYDDGVASVEGTTSNPFQLLRNGFDAVASILNIYILPGLTLGVLIFAPLVVTIIIVLVKMFRG